MTKDSYMLFYFPFFIPFVFCFGISKKKTPSTILLILLTTGEIHELILFRLVLKSIVQCKWDWSHPTDITICSVLYSWPIADKGNSRYLCNCYIRKLYYPGVFPSMIRNCHKKIVCMGYDYDTCTQTWIFGIPFTEW